MRSRSVHWRIPAGSSRSALALSSRRASTRSAAIVRWTSIGPSAVMKKNRSNRGASSSASNTLRSFKAKATYYYDKEYGATLAYFRTSGSPDDGLYNTGDPVTGSVNGRPDSSAWLLELDWLPRRDIRIAAQYTGYQKFNGASNNYDGFGRNASDNDTLYLVAWFMF